MCRRVYITELCIAVVLITFVFAVTPVCAQETAVEQESQAARESGSGKELLRFQLSNQYTRVVREDLRVYTNNSYRGFLYREQRAYLHHVLPSVVEADLSDAGQSGKERFYRGEVYVLKETNRGSTRVARTVEREYRATLRILENGTTNFVGSEQVPFRTNYPLLPEEPVAVGEQWRATGTEYLLREDGTILEAPFRCTYAYEGRESYQGRPALRLTASYSYYDLDPYRDKGGVKVRGKLDASILLYTDDRGGYFIRERVERYLLNTSEGRRRESGFRLVWSEGFSSRHLDGMEERIVQALTGDGGDTSGGAGDGSRRTDDGSRAAGEREAEKGGSEEETAERGIEVSRSDEGVVVNLPDIHFVPDQARILPDERGRLDRLAELLRQVPNATFLVKGHTADVGSMESQIALSKERAKTIIDELEKRGFASSRFIYRGLGGSEPVASNETEEGRAKNRRVEIVVLPK